MPSTSSAASSRRIRGLDADERRAQRRADLLDAALTLFAEQGYHDAAIEQICKRAYVGTKSFYEIFSSKEDVYLALQERIVGEVTGRLVEIREASEGPEEPAEEELTARALVQAFAHGFVDDVRIAKVTFGEGRANTDAAERLRRANRRWAAEFVESTWHRFGLEPDRRHRGVAIGLIGGLFDIVADWLLDADTADLAARAELEDTLVRFYATVRAGLTSL